MRRRRGEPRDGAGKGSSDLGVSVVASVSIALPLLFYLHQHVEMLKTGYEIDALKERRQVLTERRRQLAVERARRARLENVEERARAQGLVVPAVDDLRVVGEGSGSGASDAEGDAQR